MSHNAKTCKNLIKVKSLIPDRRYVVLQLWCIQHMAVQYTAFLMVSSTPSVCQVVLAMRSVTSGTASIAFISFPGLIWYQTLKKMSGLNNAGSHPCGRLPEHNTCPTESLGVFDCLRLLADHSLQMDEVVAQCIEGFHALLSYSICHRRIG